jgi:hypothetical protein
MTDAVIPPAQAWAVVIAGMTEGRARRLMRATPGVAARIVWWSTGAVGHYPDCGCDACQRRHAEPVELHMRSKAYAFTGEAGDGTEILVEWYPGEDAEVVYVSQRPSSFCPVVGARRVCEAGRVTRRRITPGGS